MVSHKSAPQSTDSQPPLASQNEDIEFNASLQGNALDLGPEYVHAGSCRAEALWTSEPAFPNGGRFLQNSIWVKKSTWRVEKASALNVSRAVTPLSKLPVLPRCAVVAHLVGSGSQTATIPRKIFRGRDARARSAGGARVSLASVHLTGGRFTDSRWRDFAGEKRLLPTNRIRIEEHLQTPHPPCRFEVETTVSLGGLPDVVVGDLNSYWNASDVVSHQKTYGPYIAATEAGHEEGYVSWAMEGVLGLEALGYTRLPGIDQDPGMRIWSSLKPRDLTHS